MYTCIIPMLEVQCACLILEECIQYFLLMLKNKQKAKIHHSLIVSGYAMYLYLYSCMF